MKSIARGDIELGSEEERKKETEQLDEKKRELSDLLNCLRVHLQEQVKEVRISNRLTSSVACLVADDQDMSARMQRMMEQLGHAVPKAKPVLELNPGHPMVEKLRSVFQESNADPRLPLYAQLLFGQAYLADTGHVQDPSAFGSALVDLMTRAL
jgi:molecular chaperone HtpG